MAADKCRHSADHLGYRFNEHMSRRGIVAGYYNRHMLCTLAALHMAPEEPFKTHQPQALLCEGL